MQRDEVDRDEVELELFVRKPAQPEAQPVEIDAAESRWDPWLLALARLEAQSEARPD